MKITLWTRRFMKFSNFFKKLILDASLTIKNKRIIIIIEEINLQKVDRNIFERYFG